MAEPRNAPTRRESPKLAAIEQPASCADVGLGPLEDAVGYLLRRGQLAVFEDFARRFEALRLTPAQFSTLIAIAENPGRRQSDIAAALGVQRPNFVALMDELERRGIAERVRFGADRRANSLRLTPAGAVLLDHALAAQAEQEAAIRALIGEPARRWLLDTLERLSRM
jgi:DNA-binding MarR family transcriptional regulator